MLQGNESAPLYEAVFGWLTSIQRSVRTKQYRLIFYPPLQRYQLFDVGKDPWELNDLASNPDLAPVLAEMKARLHHMQTSLGDPMAKA
jgi:choline-sulfatase